MHDLINVTSPRSNICLSHSGWGHSSEAISESSFNSIRMSTTSYKEVTIFHAMFFHRIISVLNFFWLKFKMKVNIYVLFLILCLYLLRLFVGSALGWWCWGLSLLRTFAESCNSCCFLTFINNAFLGCIGYVVSNWAMTLNKYL